MEYFMGTHVQNLYRNITYWAKNSVRSILKTNYRERSYPLFIRLNWITLHDIYEIEVGKCMYKYMYGSLPDLIYFHLNMLFILIEQDKRAIYVLSLALLKELQTVHSVKVQSSGK